MKLNILFALMLPLTLSCFGQDRQVSGEFGGMSDTSSNRGERLFVHIDKTQYLAGEISWFKVYLVDAISHKSSGISKVAYVEILDNANNAVLQGKIAMEHGTGTGSFVIPGTLKTGNYLLRGYTSWMKNFSSDDFFKQPVTIINTRQTYVPDSSLTIRQSTMDFFPESGSLVAGVKSVVAFRYADPSGKGVISSGVIVNNSNDTITTFSSSSQGIGHFEFTPVTGEMYKAVVSGQTGAPGTFSLPSAQEKGFVIHAISQADRVVIEVSTTANEQEGLLVIHQAGQHYFTRKIVLARASSQVEVSKAMLRSGVNTITLFDYKGRAVAERLVFQLPRQLALKTSTANREYGRREKVEVSVGAGRPSNLSASVYQQAPGDEFSQDIFTSLWFAELPQFNGLISTYLNGTSDSLEVFDDLMLTFGYRKLSGQDELRKPSLKYLPEIEAHIVEGMITNIATGKPGNRIMAFLTIPGRTPEFYTSESDSTGLIRFVVSRYYGEAEMIVQTDLRRDSMYKIDIRSPFSDAQHSIIRPYNYNSGVEQWLEKAALAVQVNNHFNSAPLHTYLEHVSDSFLFYRKPFEAYNLDEYKRFTTMDEVLREYVPGIVLRRRGGKNVIDVADYQRKLIFEDPLLLIDGVPVFQSEQLLKYDPLKIRKLEVVTNRYVYGPSVFNGIASWQTYAGDLDGFSPDPRAIVIDYGGLQLQRQYYTPVYETAEQKNSRIPDYRTTLTWNPYIKTNAGSGSFSFFTSDQPGTYKVVVQGLDEQGNAGSSTISFDVK